MKKMRLFIYGFLLLLVSSGLVSSCHKSSGANVGPASLNVVNAMTASSGIIPVFSTANLSQYMAFVPPVGNKKSALFSPLSGADTLLLVQPTDTAPKPRWLFNGILNLEAGGIYSLFVAGDSTKIDTMFVRDNIPYYTDSSAGCRFVNLSPGSQPFTITLKGNPASQQEFGPLGYKNISSFKKYVANSTVPKSVYNFVIRSQAGDSLTSFTWTYSIGKNNTIVISGIQGSAVQSLKLGAFAVNNY